MTISLRRSSVCIVGVLAGCLAVPSADARGTGLLGSSSGLPSIQPPVGPVSAAGAGLETKAEDWPGQFGAYRAFAQILTAEDTGAREDPDNARYHRPEYEKIISLTRDEVGVMWSTLLAADHSCSELDSEFQTRYPNVPPVQSSESAKNGPSLSEAEVADAAAKKSQAFTDLKQKKDLIVYNAIEELKLQLGRDDFLRLDRWVRDQSAHTHPPQHHPARQR